MATEKPIEEMSDEELEAAERRANGEASDHNPEAGEPEGGEAPAPTPGDDTVNSELAPPAKDTDKPAEAAAPQGAGAEAPAAEPQGEAKPAGKVEGVLSKDGSRVLPYSALLAERRSARAANAKAERLERELEQTRQQIEDLKSGKSTDGEELTEEHVAHMEANFPEEGKRLRKAFDRLQELEKSVAKPASDTDDVGDDPTQEAIDQVPLLLEWQHNDAKLFSRAQEIDSVLLKSPKWSSRSAVERFTEVTRMVAEEHDIPFEAPPSPKAGDKPAAKPAAAATPARKPPETLSDFKGGSVADHGSIDISRATPKTLLSRMQGMSDDEIDAHLAKYGG